MKIVINECYGGFGLSHKAVMEYAKLKGFKLYAFSDGKGKGYKPYNGEDTFMIFYSKKPLKNGKIANKDYFSPRDIKRHDPELVKVVKKLKEKANGSHAELKIVEIPDGISWSIEDYDGQEWISEIHRTWS